MHLIELIPNHLKNKRQRNKIGTIQRQPKYIATKIIIIPNISTL